MRWISRVAICVLLCIPNLLHAQENFSSVDKWLKALEKPDKEERYAAVYALEEIRGSTSKAAKKLYQALEHPDPFVRRYAALALGEHQLDPENAIPRLCELLKDKEAEVQHYARVALSKYGQISIPYLIKVLEKGGPPYQIEYAEDDLTSDVRHSIPATHAIMALLDLNEGVFDQLFLQVKKENEYVLMLADSLRKISLGWEYTYYAHPQTWVKLPLDSSLFTRLAPYKEAFLDIKNGKKDERRLKELERGLQSSQLDIARFNLQLLWNLCDPQADSLIAKNLTEKAYAISPYLLAILGDRYDKYGEPYPEEDEEFDFLGGKSWNENESFVLRARKDLSPIFLSFLGEIEGEASAKDRLQISRLYYTYFPQEKHTYDYLLDSFYKEEKVKRKCEYFSLISRLTNFTKLKVDWPSLIDHILQAKELKKKDWEVLNLGSLSLSNTEVYAYLEGKQNNGTSRERYLSSLALENNPARDSAQLDSLFLALKRENDPDVIISYLNSLESKRNQLAFDKDWLDLFEKLSKSTDERLRSQTFYLMYQRFRNKEGVLQVLLQVFDDESYTIRDRAIYWLGAIIADKEERLDFILNQILKEEDPRLQNKWIKSSPKGLKPSALLKPQYYNHFKKTLYSKDSTSRAYSLANCLSAHPKGEKLGAELLEFLQDDAASVRITLLNNLLTFAEAKRPQFQGRIDFEDSKLTEALLKHIPIESNSSIRKTGIELLSEISACEHKEFFQHQLQREIKKDTARRNSGKYQAPSHAENVVSGLLIALAKCQKDPLAGIAEDARSPYQEKAYLMSAQYKLKEMDVESFETILTFSPQTEKRVLDKLRELIPEDKDVPPNALLLEKIHRVLLHTNSGPPNFQFGWGHYFLPYLRQHIDEQYGYWKRHFDTTTDDKFKLRLLPILLLKFEQWEEEVESLFLHLLQSPESEVRRITTHLLDDYLKIRTETDVIRSSDALKKQYISLFEDPDFDAKRELLDIMYRKGEVADLGKELTYRLFEDDAPFFKDQLIRTTFDQYGSDSSYWFILISLLGSEEALVFYEASTQLKRVLNDYPDAAKSLTKAALRRDERASIEFVKLLLESDVKDQEVFRLLLPLLHKDHIETDFWDAITQLRKKLIIQLNFDPSFEVKHSGNLSTLGENNNLPKLSWPPPAYTKRSLLPSHLLGSDSDSLGTILKNLTAILYESGYRERRIFQAREGFAVLTQLERIHEDVRPWDGIDRWTQKELPPLNIGDYLSRLFLGSTGHYRVLLFIVTDLEDIHGPAGPEVTGSQMAVLSNIGSQVLPKSYRSRSFKDMSVHCLIYQFERRNGGETLLIRQSPFVVEDHLQKAGFMDKLNQFARKRE